MNKDEQHSMDLFEDTYCHQCRTRTHCEPVARKNEQREVTVQVLCPACRIQEGSSQSLDTFLVNVKQWLFKLRRGKKTWSEKHLSCSAYTYEILQRVTDTYVPEPQRGVIHEILSLHDEITSND